VKLNTTLVLPLAALLVVGAAGAVLATSGGTTGGDTGTVVPAAESASPDASADTTLKPARDGVLTDVLDDLVGIGTITESQKTAILDALTAEREARRAERQERMQQLRDILEDGQITQAELDQLPEDSRIRQLDNLDELMADGSITTDELRSLGRGLGRGLGLGRGRGWHGFGGHGFFGGPNDVTPDASASPSASS
jgi:polyhydroxyalkanoate synthesis regulator phasin